MIANSIKNYAYENYQVFEIKLSKRVFIVKFRNKVINGYSDWFASSESFRINSILIDDLITSIFSQGRTITSFTVGFHIGIRKFIFLPISYFEIMELLLNLTKKFEFLGV